MSRVPYYLLVQCDNPREGVVMWCRGGGDTSVMCVHIEIFDCERIECEGAGFGEGPYRDLHGRLALS